jgi:hypothetical protein
MDNLNAEMELLRDLSSRTNTPRFTAVDDLPLNREDPAERRHAPVEFSDRFGGSQAQNQYFRGGGASDTRSDSRRGPSESPRPQVPRFSHASEPQLGGFSLPLQSEAVSRGGDFSVRRASGVENVTTRETKRPKEREKDKEYRRRTLTHADSSFPIFADREGVQTWPIEVSRASYENVVHGGSFSPHRSVPSPFEQRTDAVASVREMATGNGKTDLGQESPRQGQGFEVNLVHAGQTVRQLVHEDMMVGQLAIMAAGIYDLDPYTVVLLLFGMDPCTLDRMLFLRGPPRVGPNATVMVFVVPGLNATERTPNPTRGGERSWPPEVAGTAGMPSLAGQPPRMHTKLLGTFKLPKFDGAAKHWKQWDRDFVRFLGLHQLEHVLLEDFESFLPRPDAVASNKIVYFLIEEAVLPGTLASKYMTTTVIEA